MNRQEWDALEARVQARAHEIWRAQGEPEGGEARYVDEARALIAFEEVPPPTLSPDLGGVEEASLQRNLGEFPTLTDQGEEQTFPDAPGAWPDPTAAAAAEAMAPEGVAAVGFGRLNNPEDGDRMLSDQDAGELGGVMPQDAEPVEDLPEVAVGDGDVTASEPSEDGEISATDDPEAEDINDDGVPDQPSFAGAGP